MKCMAPIDVETMCGYEAHETVTVEGLVIPLCHEHAEEFHRDEEIEAEADLIRDLLRAN